MSTEGYIADYIAIRDLSVRYNRYADASDGENYAALFTEDGVFNTRAGIFEGREQLAAVCSAAKGIGHITTDPLIEVDGDEATQTSRIIVFRQALDKSNVEFVTTGMYYDRLVRTAAGWRFKERRGELDLDPSIPAPSQTAR